jgi:hypothetical protein
LWLQLFGVETFLLLPKCQSNGRDLSGRLRKYGKGTSARLYQESQEIKQWESKHLEQLIDAAKKGYPVYVQLYNELMPARR